MHTLYLMPKIFLTFFYLILISGCASSPTLKEIENADPTQLSKEEAMNMCYVCAEKFGKGIPEVVKIYNETCDEASSVSSILGWSQEMCGVWGK